MLARRYSAPPPALSADWIQRVAELQDHFEKALLPALLPEHEGKWALIHEDTLAGLYSTLDAACEHRDAVNGRAVPVAVARVAPMAASWRSAHNGPW